MTILKHFKLDREIYAQEPVSENFVKSIQAFGHTQRWKFVSPSLSKRIYRSLRSLIWKHTSGDWRRVEAYRRRKVRLLHFQLILNSCKDNDLAAFPVYLCLCAAVSWEWYEFQSAAHAQTATRLLQFVRLDLLKIPLHRPPSHPLTKGYSV